MNKTIIIIIVVLVLGIGGYFLLRGGYQTPTSTTSLTPVLTLQAEIKEGTLEEVKTKFTNTTLADWEGYQKDQFCIDGSVIGQPKLGGMGFHAEKTGLLGDNIIDPLEPEVLLLDVEDNIIGVEYMVQSSSQPSLFGAQFEPTPEQGHPGFEVPHWDLHLWLVDNPAGTFAAFNPDVVCPEGSLPPAPSPETVAPEVKEVTIVGTEYSFSPSSISVKAGDQVKIVFQNIGRAPHNLIIEDLGIGTKTIGGEQADIIEFIAPSTGIYTFFCSVGAHRAAGMEGSLKVE